MLTEHQLRAMPLGQNSSFQGALSSRPNPAHRPKVGGRLLSFPAQVPTLGALLWSWGCIIGPRCHKCPQWWCGKEPLSSTLERLGSVLAETHFWKAGDPGADGEKTQFLCAPVTVMRLHTWGLFALSPFKTSAQDGPWGGQLGAGSCAVFWNLLRHRVGT